MNRKSWIVGSIISGSVFFLGITYWLLFYSDYLANTSFIIPIRNWYNTHTSSFLPTYAIKVQKSSVDGYYTYVLFGTISDVDLSNQLIHLNGNDKNKYTFGINSFVYEHRGKTEGVITNPLATGVYVQVSWQDKRSLIQIKKDYLEDKLKVQNQDSPEGVTFTKFD